MLKFITENPKGTSGCESTSFEQLCVKIVLKLRRVASTYNGIDRRTRYPDGTAFFSRMRRSVTAGLIQTKFCTLTPWADVIMYMKMYPNLLRCFGGAGVRILAYPQLR